MDRQGNMNWEQYKSSCIKSEMSKLPSGATQSQHDAAHRIAMAKAEAGKNK